jgi:hypothetical protein
MSLFHCSAVGIEIDNWLDDQGIIVPHLVQTGSGVHPDSYLMDVGGSLTDGKAADAWS